MSFWGWLKNLFKSFRVRSGLDKFLEHYLQVAAKVILHLSVVHDGASFNEWKQFARDEVVAQLKADGQEIRDTWIEILLNLAFENFKAQLTK